MTQLLSASRRIEISRDTHFSRLAPRVLVAILACLGTVLAQPVVSDAQLAAACRTLRYGSMEPEAVEQVMTGLHERSEKTAARWWLREAERGLDQGGLPRTWKRKLAQWRRKVEALPESDPAGSALARDLANHLRVLTGRRVDGTARRLLPLARSLLDSFPDKRSHRMVAAAEAALQARKGSGDPDRMPARHVEKTRELEPRARELIGKLVARDLITFESYGHLGLLSDLEQRVSAQYGPDESRDALGKLREAARRLGPTKKLEIRIRGLANELRISRAGQRLARLSVDWRNPGAPLEVTRLEVISGDLLLVRTVGGREDTAEKGGRDEWLNTVLAVHVRLDGTSVPASRWATLPRDDEDKVSPSLQPVAVGQKRLKKDESGHHELTFRIPRSDLTLIPWEGDHAAMEKVFREAGTPPAFILGWSKQAIYALRIP